MESIASSGWDELMKRHFPLSSVLRVRQAREEVARAEAARASANLNIATDRAIGREASLLERTLPADSPIAAFLGAVTATRSMATEVAGLYELARIRQAELAQAQQKWTVTEQESSAVQQLAERHRLTVQHELQRAEQREMDELSQRPRRVTDWALESDVAQP